MRPLREKRLFRLVDANPGWMVKYGADGETVVRDECGLTFNCPIHENCRHAIVFANPRDGGPPLRGEPLWHRTGETFDELTLSPSIRVLGESCNWHGFIREGRFEHCDDSR